jgi:hypothetical protein
MSELNIPLCRKVLACAEAEQAMIRHDQSTWLTYPSVPGSHGRVIEVDKMRVGRCGGSACLAGFVVLLAAPEGTCLRLDDDMLMFPDGGEQDIQLYARQWLGLTASQAACVFEGGQADDEAIRKLREYMAQAEEAQRND